MRHLIVTRGAPGAGKSTFLDEQGLTPYVVSPDSIRLQFGGLVMAPDGNIDVSHAHEKQVWARVQEILDFRMSQGQLVVLDATHQQTRDFNMAVKSAERHRYECFCIDFTSVPADIAQQRNLMRPDWKIVPAEVIDRAYERFAKHAVPKKITVWDHAEFGTQGVLDRLEPEIVDLSQYRQVVHVGDLQGCYAPVQELFADGMKDDVFYIFIGDLLDRGIQNGEVIRFAMDHIAGKPNVQLLWGNHEYHIHRFARRQDPVSREFLYNTLPQIQAAGFTVRDANQLLNETVDVMAYTYRGYKVLASHAGIARVPERLAILPSRTFWNGTGTYDDPVDKTFSANMAGAGWLQVHGHRNSKKLPVEAMPGSFNLEAEIEFGGHLRVMTLTGVDGGAEITTSEIRNTVFRTERDKRPDKLTKGDVGETGKISELLMKRLETHPLVRVKSFATRPHLKSMNFTHKAFFSGKWDEVNIMARGLFVADDRRVVARSYPKFFNLEERAETQMRNLKRSLVFPLKMWVKENGFLGILGWDHLAEDPGLLFASKSTPEGDFASWFQEIFRADAGEDGVDRAADLVRNRNLCLIFEVNDPVRDPHMIAYEAPHVVLLDAVFREEKFKKLSYLELQQVAAAIGVRVKGAGPTLSDWNQFEGWNKSIQAQGRYFQWNGKDIEGFVAEDAAGFMFKIKLNYYSFWKAMRTHKDRIRTAREKERPAPLPRFEDEEARRFHDWLATQPTELLDNDIISLRTAYLSDLEG